MALVTCPVCASDEDIHVDAKLDDGRLQVRCGDCGTGWMHGQPTAPATKPMSSFDKAWLRFPTPAMVTSGRAARVAELKQQFLAITPVEDPAVAPYWRHFQQVFSRNGLWTCKPQDLKDFANSDVGANPGNMSVFNTAWNQMGGGRRGRAGTVHESTACSTGVPDDIPLEDRLTHLIVGQQGHGNDRVSGESLLTRVLCVVQAGRGSSRSSPTPVRGPESATYTQTVFGLKMPKQDQVSMQIGRLGRLDATTCSSDLVGDGFASCQHASAFLWWAKDQHFGAEAL